MGEFLETSGNKPSSGLDPRRLRNALGSFATGITIITANDLNPDNYVGITANSFSSISLNPPLILWSLDKKARSLSAYQSSEYFAVNILSADQIDLANRFATQQPDKFNSIEFDQGVGGVPLFRNCAAHFQCKISFCFEGGDHIIFVGEVLQFDDFNRPGLVFYKGKYSLSHTHPQLEKTDSSGFVDDYLHYLLLMATSKFEKNFSPIIENDDIQHYEWRVLAMLSDKSGRKLADMAEMGVMDQVELQNVLDVMQHSDLIISEGDKDCWYSLTEQGKEQAHHLLAAAKAHETQILDGLGTTEAQLLKNSLKFLIKNTAAHENSLIS